MAVWSEVWLSALPGAFRLDPEFWQPEYLRVEGAIKGLPHETLGKLSISLQKGVFNILADSYVEEGIPFYRSSNVGAIVPKSAELAYISRERHTEEKKTALKRGDIILAKTGKEAASVVLLPECNVSQDVIAIRPDRKRINPFYLAVFLNTQSGILQMRRWFQGQVQMHLSLPDTREILVHIPDSEDQDKIESLIVASESKRRAADRATTTAETKLMEALGLDHLDLSPEKCYSRPFRDLQAESRFDAEYFNPKYQRILERLRAGGKTIADIATLSERAFDTSVRRKSPTCRYIEIGSLSGDGEADAEIIDTIEAPSRATWVVKSGDIITSAVRPIRRLSAMIGAEQDGCVCSSGFAVLTPNPGGDGIEPEVLLTYLRLPVICEILDLNTTASMYPAVPVHRLMRIPVLVPGKAVRSQIVEKVREGIALRRESARLLEQAKKTVEDMIVGGTDGKQR